VAGQAMMTTMKPHQLLILLLTLVLLVVNLPTCETQRIFEQRARYMRRFRDARLEAHSRQRRGFRQMSAKTRYVDELVKRAADQANATSAVALQAFYKVRWLYSLNKCK